MAPFQPDYTFLVIDAMLGQDAVNVAEAFHETLNLDGVILSKLDGDARGGAALSVKGVTGKPIVFASVGEKQDRVRAVLPRPHGAAHSRAWATCCRSSKRPRELSIKTLPKRPSRACRKVTSRFEDFLEQLQQVKKMGSMSGLLKMMPGVPKEVKNAEIDDREIAGVEAMIRSMTPAERDDPSLINGSRRQRIADGSGKTTSQVNQLIKQFSEVQKMMKGFSRMGGLGRKGKKGKKGGRITPAGTPALGGPKLPAGMPQLPPGFEDLPGMPKR